MKKLKSDFMLLLTAFIWGSAFVAQKQGSENLPTFAFNGMRMVLAVTFLIPVILIMDAGRKSAGKKPNLSASEKKQERKTLLKGGIACGVMLCTASSLQQFGVEFTTSGKAGFITTLYVVLVPLLGMFIGKKVRRLLWGCVGLAIVGLYLLSIKPGDFSIEKGDFFVLICAVFFAIHILIIDYFSSKTDPVKLSCVQFAVTAVISLFLMAIFENPTFSAIESASLPLLYAGIMSGGVAYTLQIVAQRDADPTIASLLLSFEAVFAAISGAVILGEAMSAREATGCIIMFIATTLAQLPEKGTSEKLNNS